MQDHHPDMNNPGNGPPQQPNDDDMEDVVVDEVIDLHDLDDEGIAAEGNILMG